jgi:formate/nitrite transporter
MSDYVKPDVLVSSLIDSAITKAATSPVDLLVRGALAGAYLAFVTSMALLIAAQTGQFVVGALLFPAGFALIVMLKLELLTGNFAILPMAWFAGEIGLGAVLRNWALVFLGNLLGSLIYAALFWIAATEAGHTGGGPAGDQLRALAVHKTTAYEALGMAGLLTVFVRAVLCNWMVSLASIMGLASTSTVGKILGCWLPIFIFFEQGFEHSVVNMFVIPAGMMLGANISFYDWWAWNEIPVALGNMVGAVVFTGGALYFTYHRGTAASRVTAPVLQAAEPVR